MTALFPRICPGVLVSVVMQVSLYFQPIRIEVKRRHADYHLLIILLKLPSRQGLSTQEFSQIFKLP